MGSMVLKNGEVISNCDADFHRPEVIAYIYNTDKTRGKREKLVTDIHKDIIIKEKDKIFIKIPFVIKKVKGCMSVIIDEKLCIGNYEDDLLIEFLKEKMILYNSVDSYMVALFIFEYFACSYTEELLMLEERIETLFENAIDKGIIDNKKILKIKKSVSLIKRYTTYYISMITYLDDEFKKIELLPKVIFILENTLNLVENLEVSIYSCIDIYNSVLSNRMNRTMQLLTVITVSTLPLTIASGIFGMNFRFMPLLEWQNGFYIAMGGTIVIVIGNILYFKKKKYL